ncbi:hypothetical protein CVT25_007125 [Psilocybe cyanescens]|uniref:Histone deacetylase interacting domain-containing protein n=1 Tax=Psilocybe cyanescens TaxID=93625 RepID=A0A409WVW4_PSICY|nr:hypothetical protein CVT25_007125 [Psilocybe cyanescens]
MTMDAHSRKSKAHLGRSSLTRDDGNTYLDAIQAEFQDQPAIYNQFVVTMKQFKNDEISTSTVMQRVADLFKGHPALIQGFNVFLPAGVTMETSSNSSPGPSSLPSLRSTQAKAVDKLDEMYKIIRFTEKVQQRYGPDVYDDFVSILSEYYHRSYDVSQETIARRLKALFSDDADLYDQLQYIIGNNGDPI